MEDIITDVPPDLTALFFILPLAGVHYIQRRLDHSERCNTAGELRQLLPLWIVQRSDPSNVSSVNTLATREWHRNVGDVKVGLSMIGRVDSLLQPTDEKPQ